MTMTLEDIEKAKHLYPNHCLEIRNGSLVIRSPSDITSAVVGTNFSSLLNNWVRPRRLGQVADASAGYRSVNGDLTAPDVSFISRDKMKHSPRTYAQVIPDLVVEIKSSTDRTKSLIDKLETYLELGTLIAILIDPDTHLVSVYRLHQAVEIFTDTDHLVLPDLFPGWQVPVTELWPLEFE